MDDTLFSMLPDYTSTMFDDSSTLSMGFGASDFNTFPMSLDAPFGCFDEPLNFNLFNDDHLISDMLSDNVLMDSSLFDLPGSSLVNDNLFSSPPTPSPKRAKCPKSRSTANDTVIKAYTSNSNSISLLNNNSSGVGKAQVKFNTVVPKVTVGSPKVYIERSKKKKAGTSLLLKKPKKSNSLLSKMASPSTNVVLPTLSLNMIDQSITACYESFLHDHTYCHVPAELVVPDQIASTVTVPSCTEMKNDLDDLFSGFIPDDVVLNELPNCLQDLMDLDNDFDLSEFDSEDILHGLSDACNFMTDHYIEDLENYIDKDLILPDLNITEDDLNAVTQSTLDNDSIAKEMPLLDMASPLPDFHELDNFDSSSVTTGCTEESFGSDEMRSPRAVRTKRRRSLSSSALGNSKRKRRFSTRSSINSSDAMSDSSSAESSSSRCSSPDRSPGPFAVPFTASNGNFYRSKFSMAPSKKEKLFEPKRNLNWTKKGRAKSAAMGGVKGKLQVIDIGSSHAEAAVNEKVLYIGNIIDGTTKKDIRAWFAPFGIIEEVQLHFSEIGRNYAFVTYKSGYETTNAIKHGNDDKSHPRFLLSYGKKERKKSYKDLDSCSEDNLDFRIDSQDFDSLLRSASEYSVKLSV